MANQSSATPTHQSWTHARRPPDLGPGWYTKVPANRATTDVLECIRTITGRGFPSFGSQSAGKPKPAWMHISYASHLRFSGGKGELRQISCYTMHIVTRTASHVGSAACSGLSAAYSYVPSWPDTRGVILRFLTLWYHQPFYLSLASF